ncbi:hypothetical protein HY483_03490 [Candidatus Woesearchaeota archaeon]|nr:hypothetical protein [Candidatus Woesearchaeota archaeon]
MADDIASLIEQLDKDCINPSIDCFNSLYNNVFFEAKVNLLMKEQSLDPKSPDDRMKAFEIVHNELYETQRFKELVGVIESDHSFGCYDMDASGVAADILYNKRTISGLEATLKNLNLDPNSSRDIYHAWHIYRMIKNKNKRTKKLFYEIEKRLAHLKGERGKKHQVLILDAVANYISFVMDKFDRPQQRTDHFVRNMIKVLPKILKFNNSDLLYFIDQASCSPESVLSPSETSNKILSTYKHVINHAASLNKLERDRYFLALRNIVRSLDIMAPSYISQLESRIVMYKSKV